MRIKLLLMLLAVALMAGLAQANMIANPGFEDGELLGGTDVPDEWVSNFPLSPLHTWLDDSAEAHSGNRYVRVKNWTGGNYSSGLIQLDIPVTEGENYAFSIWAKCSTEDDPTPAYAYYEWYDPCSIILGEGLLGGDEVSDQWQFVDCGSIVAPAGAVTCDFSVWVPTDNGYKKTMYDDVDMRIASISDADPAGERFKGAHGAGTINTEVLLSWDNMDPNNPADPNVYVDVWFGTEPNNTGNSKWVKVIDANEPAAVNATFLKVDAPPLNAPAPTPYYWKVVSYPYGHAKINGPNSIESLTYEFTSLSEQPVEVVIDTNDMVTWLGQPVSLNATISDDGDSPVTYLWEATDTGASFDPNDTNDTVVTFTVGSYPNALIVNPSFEDGLTGWDPIGDGEKETWNGVYYAIHHIDPTDGGAIASVYNDANEDTGFSQTLRETLAAETDYSLTVDVANDGYSQDDIVTYKVQLLAGGTLIAEDNSEQYLPLPLFYPADWETSTVAHTSGTAGADPNIGQPLEIRLLLTGEAGGVTFDNVNLTSSPEFPTLSGHPYTLTVTATDNVGSDSATMNIKVYDTPCNAGRLGVGLGAINFTDIVGDPGDDDPTEPDCDTDIYDFAALVKTWLDESELTVPLTKP